MAHLVQSKNLSQAWVEAMERLVELPGGKAVNFNVAFPADGVDDQRVSEEIDAFLRERELRSEDHEVLEVGTVANTIFPDALYHHHLGDAAAARLYENYELSMRMHRRRKRDKDTYFNRLTAYPVVADQSKKLDMELAPNGTFNQLDYHVRRLRGQRTSAHLSSSYEMGLSHPFDAELRVHAPLRDKRMSGFPCLSHISLTLADDRVHMTATYRNQTFITRAYGNYLGLARLLRFVATETGARPGEVEVVATHADAEIALGTRAIGELVSRCRAALTSEVEADA
jgi:hypothetical protein